jgi:glycosyltransferase involved in cell wall biosynthesis
MPARPAHITGPPHAAEVTGAADIKRTDFWASRRFRQHRPTVSVIVPTYNRAAFLERTIASIFSQTVHIHEVIVVDDGSTDETRAVVDGILSGNIAWHGRLRYYWQPNSGKSAALNAGLKHASGDWIAFNDSDDQWLPRKLELQFTALAEYEDAGACFTDVRFVNNPALKETAFEVALLDRTSPFGVKACVSRLYSTTWPGIYMQSLLVSRPLMSQVGDFDVSMRMGMDTDFAFRLGLITSMAYVNLPLVDVDRTSSRAIGLLTEYPLNSVGRLEAHERMLTKWLSIIRRSHAELKQQLLNRLSQTQSALANHHLKRGDLTTARTILGRAAKQNPRVWLVMKFLWSLVAPESLRKEILRRERKRQEQEVARAHGNSTTFAAR